jgi:hypothetical protein
MATLVFPVIISDLPEMKRMIRTITREVLAEATKETPVSNISPFLTQKEAYRQYGGRYLIEKAVTNNSLFIREKEGRKGFLRKELEEWQNRYDGDRATSTKKVKSPRSYSYIKSL